MVIKDIRLIKRDIENMPWLSLPNFSELYIKFDNKKKIRVKIAENATYEQVGDLFIDLGEAIKQLG